MHKPWMMVLMLLTAFLPPEASAHVPRIRVLEPEWATLLGAGVARSETLRRLVADLETSDVIVHIVRTLPDERKSAGALQFVTSSGGFRFLRIRIVAGLSNRLTLSLMGHELQHALEVAREAAVVDQDTFEDLYQRVGFSVDDPRCLAAYDTHDARAVQRLVFGELEAPAVRLRDR